MNTIITYAIMLGVAGMLKAEEGIKIGYEVRDRAHVDSADRQTMIPDITQSSPINGDVIAFRVYTANAGRLVHLGIWRPMNGENYKYLGGVDFTPSAAGYHNVELPENEVISVHIGDVVGFQYGKQEPRGVIKFDTVPGCNGQAQLRLMYSTPTLTVGDVQSFSVLPHSSWFPCRQYSIRAVIREEIRCAQTKFNCRRRNPCTPLCRRNTLLYPGNWHTKYIQCGADGSCEENRCERKYTWNQDTQQCVLME